MAAAGYNVGLQGQVALHQAGERRRPGCPRTSNQYGFTRWNPPDAGRQPGHPRGRRRRLRQRRPLHERRGRRAEAGTEGALQYLSSAAAQQQPFFLVVSLVNPHDVLFYPQDLHDGGYDDSWLEGDIELPRDGRRGPLDQADACRSSSCSSSTSPGAEHDPADEAQLPELLRQPDEGLRRVPGQACSTRSKRPGCCDDTLVIRTADHGEMGTGARRDAAEELQLLRGVDCGCRSSTPTRGSSRRPRSTDALVSHVDFLPTLASLVDAPAQRPRRLAGRRLLRSRPAPASRQAAAGLRRLHLRRLAVRAGERALPEAAEPHRQHPRGSAGSSPSTTTPTATCPTSGRCTTSSTTRWSAEPRRQGLTSAPRSRSASTGGCGASSRRSRGRGCSR